MATLTASAAQPNQPRVTTDGTLIRRYQTYTASMSAGDIVRFRSIPIPHGAKITSFTVSGVLTTTSTTSVSIAMTTGFAYSGTTNYSAIGAAATLSQAWGAEIETMTNSALSLAASTRWPLTISVSDDYQPRYVLPQVTVGGGFGSATGSKTVIITVKVDYQMDQ